MGREAVIVVGSTVAAWKCDGSELNWTRHAKRMRELSPVPLEFFCAVQRIGSIEHEGWGDTDKLQRLFDRVIELRGDGPGWWNFGIDGWAPDTARRLVGITTGRNLVREYVLRDTDATHVLYLDTDVEPDPACVPKLLELDHPVAGGHVGEYCLSGPRVEKADVWRARGESITDDAGHLRRDRNDAAFPFPVEEHWNTAGFLLVRRDVLREVAWRWEGPGLRTDDPCFAIDVERAGFGRTWVRKDCVGKHAQLVPVEQR